MTSVLLHKLAWDDEFRSRLESRPHEVFAEYGLKSPADIPVTLTLPAKDEFRAVLASAIEHRKTSGADPGLFCWFV